MFRKARELLLLGLLVVLGVVYLACVVASLSWALFLTAVRR